jgi:hypothetical protein
MPRQEGGHEQPSYKRAQQQADEAVDGGSKGQIELRRKAVEHRLGYLTSTISFILGDILGRNYRAQQIGGCVRSSHRGRRSAIPHHASSAHRAFLRCGLAALPAVREALRHDSADVRYWCCQFLDHFLVPEVMDDLISRRR